MGFELRDMEDRVDPEESLWKMDGIGSSGRFLDDFVGSEMSFRELFCRTGSSNELGSDEYLISNFEDGVRFTLLICNLLVTFRSICDLLTEVFVDGVNVVHIVTSGGFRNCDVGEGNRGMITLVSKERSDSGRGVQSIVECKLCDWKELVPIVLLVGAVHPDILFEGLIHLFHLSVCQQIVARGVVHFHAK